jgi:two-component system cell cycle response regulator
MNHAVDRSLIVVVADDPARQEAVTSLLTASGHRLMDVSDPLDALEYCRRVTPDLVLLDIDSTPMRAMGVLDSLHTSRLLNLVPVVTMSGSDDRAVAVNCLRRGARDHVRVPFDDEELLARIDVQLSVNDLHERLRHRNEELEYLGGVDALTGLPNRRQMDEELFRLAAAATRHHQPLAAVLLSIDNWEAIGARGEVCADAVLREVAVLVIAIQRTDDVAGRFGDNEYLILLPMTTGEGARTFAERIRAAVNAAPIATDAGPVSASLSAGCADGAPGPNELLDRARMALRQAESAGGDTQVSISF